MARRDDWETEIEEAVRKENWSLTGPTRVIKVTAMPPPGTAISLRASSGGYITLAKSIGGMTPAEIEVNLGLPPQFLEHGAIIYNFLRLPQSSEYTYELTAKHPGGLVYNPGHFDPRYGPGSDKIHQWEIKPGVSIPVDGPNAVLLHPGDRFRP